MTPEQICATGKRLREVMGHDFQTPPACHTLDAADRALSGDVLIGLGSQWVYEPLGREDQQWQDAHFQVHRFCVFETLGIAYAKTRDEQYASAARDYVEGWQAFIADHPDFAGKVGDSNLACARRLLIWTEWLADFRDSEAFDDAFLRKIIRSIASQLDGLVTIYNRTSPNMRFTEAEALLLCGLRLRQHPHADTWISHGAQRLNHAAWSQFLPDGAHVELTPRYNIVNHFARLFLLQDAYPDCGLSLSADKFSASYDYWLANRRPNGETNALNDSAGSNDAPRPEGKWDRTYRRFRKDTGLSSDYTPPTSQNFPAAGHAFWRSDWGEDAVYITVDASRLGGSHIHLGRNAIQLDAFGRSLLIDPGSFSYAYGDEWTHHGKATRTHNTVNINGWNQACTPAQSRFETLPGYDLAHGDYTGGYWPGQYDWGFTNGQGRGMGGSHHRTVLWIRDNFLVVLDRVYHGNRHPDDPLPFLESNWQYTASCEVEMDDKKASVTVRNGNSNLLMLFPICIAEGGLSPVHPRLEMHRGEKDPLRGWQVQDGDFVPAPQVSYVVPDAPFVVDMATVLVPYQGTRPPSIEMEAATVSGEHFGKLIVRTGAGDRHSLYWKPYRALPCSLDHVDDYYTDGTLLYLRHRADGQFVTGMALDATTVEPYAGLISPQPGFFAF